MMGIGRNSDTETIGDKSSIVLHLSGYYADITDGNEKRKAYLTPTEFNLLKILMLGKSRVLTKEDLASSMYPDSEITKWETRLVVKYIECLRNKLGDDAHDSRYILTVPRFGYRFIG